MLSCKSVAVLFKGFSLVCYNDRDLLTEAKFIPFLSRITLRLFLYCFKAYLHQYSQCSLLQEANKILTMQLGLECTMRWQVNLS